MTTFASCKNTSRGEEGGAQAGARGRGGQTGLVLAAILKRHGAHQVHGHVAQNKQSEPETPSHGAREVRHLEPRACDRSDRRCSAHTDPRTHTQRLAPRVRRSAPSRALANGSSRPGHSYSGAAEGAADDAIRSRSITWIREQLRAPLVRCEPIERECSVERGNKTLRGTVRPERPGVSSYRIEWKVSARPKVILDARNTRRTRLFHGRCNVSGLGTLPPRTALALAL